MRKCKTCFARFPTDAALDYHLFDEHDIDIYMVDIAWEYKFALIDFIMIAEEIWKIGNRKPYIPPHQKILKCPKNYSSQSPSKTAG